MIMEEILYLSQHWEKFREENKITKSLFGIRAKGTWLETHFEWLLTNGNFTQYASYSNMKDNFSIGYHENYYKGTLENIPLKICWASARLGLPLLREKGLVR
jgi:hypothetical protein